MLGRASDCLSRRTLRNSDIVGVPENGSLYASIVYQPQCGFRPHSDLKDCGIAFRVVTL